MSRVLRGNYCETCRNIPQKISMGEFTKKNSLTTPMLFRNVYCNFLEIKKIFYEVAVGSRFIILIIYIQKQSKDSSDTQESVKSIFLVFKPKCFTPSQIFQSSLLRIEFFFQFIVCVLYQFHEVIELPKQLFVVKARAFSKCRSVIF